MLIWFLIHSINWLKLQNEIFPDKETASKPHGALWGMGEVQRSLHWEGDGLWQDPFLEVTCSKPSHGVTAAPAPSLYIWGQTWISHLWVLVTLSTSSCLKHSTSHPLGWVLQKLWRQLMLIAHSERSHSPIKPMPSGASERLKMRQTRGLLKI